MLEDQKRFVGDASHELRTPLTALTTEIEVALRGKSLSTKSAKKLLNSNLEELGKMQGLINYLLTLNSYDASHDNLELEDIDLPGLVTEGVKKHKRVAAKRKIKISTSLKKATVKGNRTSLVELVTILIDNAIKYTPDNGKVHIAVWGKRRCVFLSVKDNGIGINEKDLPHIFDRFYRADRSRCKNEVNGYGLGLSIAKSIVELHKGSIKVKSTPDKGSLFSVKFPR